MSVPDPVSKVYLNVPFPAKERAKGLGARWDPVVRKWYVSEKAPLGPFAEWLPKDCATGRLAPEQLTVLAIEPDRGLALSAFLVQVADAIALKVPRSQWVRAEISQLRPVNGGHLALELVEHDAEGRLLARLQGFIWSSRAGSVCEKFGQSTGGELAVGLKVLLQLSVEMSSAYGLRAIVEDIDPAYTLGDIEARLQVIRETLTKEGLIELNRGLTAPAEFCHVAVVSPQDAAGLGDFKRDADRLADAGLCRFDYYTAKFQGPAAAASLLDALSRVQADYEHGERFDALCIIRGGGSVTDLYWLNELELARQVCRLPIPVITGIGHERDNTVLDEIAHRRCDTPSKVVGWIAGTIYANANAAIENMLGILKAVGDALAAHERAIERLRADIDAVGRRMISEASHEIERCVDQLRHQALSRLQTAEHALSRDVFAVQQLSLRWIAEADQSLERILGTVGHFGRQRIGEAAQSIDALAREVLGQGPQATLQRGFALVRAVGGGVISSAAAAVDARTLDVEFRDGTVRANVVQRVSGNNRDE